MSHDLKYHQNVFGAFENGVELDLRARLAVEFIKSQAANLVGDTQLEDVTAAGVAKFFLDLADQVLVQSEARGWTKDLPDHGDISWAMRKHIERNVRAQHFQQMVGASVAQEAAGVVQVMPPGAHGGNSFDRQ